MIQQNTIQILFTNLSFRMGAYTSPPDSFSVATTKAITRFGKLGGLGLYVSVIFDKKGFLVLLLFIVIVRVLKSS